MKRLLSTMLAWIFGIASFVGIASAASSDCLNVSFRNWDSMCLGISKNGTKNFKISMDKNNLSKNSEIKCYVIFENASMQTIKNCEWTFSHAWSSTEDVIINAMYVLRNKDFYSKRVSTEVNFNKGTWWTNHNLITSSKSSSSKSSSSSKKSSNDLKVSVSPSSPDTYDWVKLDIETDDDYVGKINFSKLQYKSNSSSSWSNISSTSSTYVSDYSSEWNNGYYRMVSSDDGEVTLKNLVKFKKSGYYRIYVEDTEGNESYVQINVDTSSSSSSSSYNDGIELSTNRKSPSTNQYVNLTIETDDDYVGRLSLSAKYRKSSSDSWSSISNTSSTYFSDYSDEWDNGFYRMTSDDDGEVTLGDLVKFKKAGYYRIYVEDYDGNESYIEFSVDTSSSSSSSYNDGIELSTNRKSPSTNQYVNLTIETDDDYVGNLSFYAKYRSSSSSSWTTIPKTSRTSSTYFSDYSDEWADGYYRMRSSDDGEVTLDDLVKFRKSGYYRIYVEDTDGNESYIEFDVDTSSSSSSSSRYYGDEIELSTNRESPSTDQYINLTIETEDDNYFGKLYLLAKYRSSSSNSWSNISNTSSTYFSDYSDEWENGFYRMTTDDEGEVTLRNLVKFRKDGYYRISVIDTDGNESYIEFSVGDVSKSSSSKSSVSWFSKSQLANVKSLYNQWDNMISQLKRDYPSLKKDTYWAKLTDSFYNNIKDVVNDKKSRNFEDYDDYTKAFNSRYKYTMNNK